MSSLRFYRVALIAALITAGAFIHAGEAVAQTEQQTQASSKIRSEEAMGLEVQLHLLIGTRTQVADEDRPPASLDAVVKQLRSTFAFKNYRLAATLLNRVKNGGRLNVRWVGGQLLPTAAATNVTPGFNDFQVSVVKLVEDDAGRNVVQMSNFNFGARIPIQISSVASTGGAVAPVVQYENTGITTDLTVRENEPTIAGTLNVGPSGDVLIIVVSARRPAAK